MNTKKWVRLSKSKYIEKMRKLYIASNNLDQFNEKDVADWINRVHTTANSVKEESEHFYILEKEYGNEYKAVLKDEYEEVTITKVTDFKKEDL